MAQDSKTLPEGAGATLRTNSATSGTSTPSPEISSRAGPAGSGGFASADTGLSSGSSPGLSSGGSSFEPDYDDDYASRELVLAERRPSTATVVGAALVGALAGAAVPFMLATRSSPLRSRGEEVTVQESIIIDRPPRVLYDFWRDFTNFPQFMDNVESVEKIDEFTSHWVIKAPAGTSVEFDSFIVDDVPGRMIAWRSDPEASVPNRGRVEFIETADGLGTNVITTISYDPPAGAAGRLVARIFGREPAIQAREDLQRFKTLMESR